MSTPNQITEELGRELHRRADGLYEAPFTFDDVRGRARGIRRRRRVAAVTATAAAVALVATLSTTLAGGLNRADEPQPAPSPSTGRGASVLHDREVTLPGGGTVPVDIDNADVSQFGVLTDGRILVANQKLSQIEVYDADGAPATTYAVDFLTFTMSSSNGLAAWIDQRGRVQLLESGSPEPVAMPKMPVINGTTPFIDAVTGDHCADGGCEVLVSDGTETVATVTLDGAERLDTSEPMRVLDVSPDGDTWAVSFRSAGGEQYPCVGLYDPAAERVTARSCTGGNLDFSPDGEHLLSGRYENNMAGEVAVLDRDLQEVAAIKPGKQVISRATWADDTHVLAVLAGLDGNRWTLVRYPLDGGDPETVAGPVRGGNPEMMSEYLPTS
ncbi:hypothetical protein ACT8ZV_20945 [Nocardioides sp. MAHUQ-72]|uniref:hypothetical protein n=1 Tax=unclassified Nocardioides TaxID=2615069 RepID=UPI00360DA653